VRRPGAGRGWPTILVLASAFGLAQAAMIDQSLFNPAYRDIPYWDELRLPTLLPGVGTSAAMIVGFVGGHVIGSIGAPIAVAEAMVSRRATEPWLGPVGQAVTALLWLGGAGIVLADTLHTESFRLSTGQLAGTLCAIAALIILAFALPRRRGPDGGAASPDGSAAPSAAVVGLWSFALLGVRPLLDAVSSRTDAAGGWAAVAIDLAAMAALGVLLLRWSGRTGWTPRHSLAVAAGALVSTGAAAFVVDPLGDVSDTAKYASNVGLLALVAAIIALAWFRSADRYQRS